MSNIKKKTENTNKVEVLVGEKEDPKSNIDISNNTEETNKVEVLVDEKEDPESNIDILNVNNDQDLQAFKDKMREIKKIAPSQAKIDINLNEMIMTTYAGDIVTTVKEKTGINFIETTTTQSIKSNSIKDRKIDAEALKRDGKTQKQIADILRVSQPTISNDLNKKKK